MHQNRFQCLFRSMIKPFFTMLLLIALTLTSPVLVSNKVNSDSVSEVSFKGEVIVVTNSGEEVNGDTSSPKALIADPGFDGISLKEAMQAAEAQPDYDWISFAPALKGATIYVQTILHIIEHGNMSIDGDIDQDGLPDVTIDGYSADFDTAFAIRGGSHVVIKGFAIRGFSKYGVSISPNKNIGAAIVQDVTIANNDISSQMNSVELTIYEQSQSVIEKVEIVGNSLHDSGGGISIHAGMGNGAIQNRISDISIRDNIIHHTGNTIGIFISPASWAGLSDNLINNIEISGNHITAGDNLGILVDTSNQANCHNNTTDGITIAGNVMDGPWVTMEFVVESGFNSRGNLMSNVAVTDNLLTRGGIQFSGATGTNGQNNQITNVSIERNKILNGMANGIYLSAGTTGAYNNQLLNVLLRDNLILRCADAGILLHGEDSYSPNNIINNVNIINQTILFNGNSWAGGININSKTASNLITNVNISNSILWGNQWGDSIRGSVAPTSVKNTLLGDARFLGADENFYMDPLFIDPGANDFDLQTTSACVDSGSMIWGPVGLVDLEQHRRIWDGNGDGTAQVDRGALEYGSELNQEIELSWDEVPIARGDFIPNPWDGTDFGSVALQETPILRTFTIRNLGGQVLHLTGTPAVVIEGSHPADFILATQPNTELAPGASTTFSVQFIPGAEGWRQAWVRIMNDDSDESEFRFALGGLGLPAQTRIYVPLILR